MRGKRRYILADIVLWFCLGLLIGFAMGAISGRF